MSLSASQEQDHGNLINEVEKSGNPRRQETKRLLNEAFTLLWSRKAHGDEAGYQEAQKSYDTLKQQVEKEYSIINGICRRSQHTLKGHNTVGMAERFVKRKTKIEANTDYPGQKEPSYEQDVNTLASNDAKKKAVLGIAKLSGDISPLIDISKKEAQIGNGKTFEQNLVSNFKNLPPEEQKSPEIIIGALKGFEKKMNGEYVLTKAVIDFLGNIPGKETMGKEKIISIISQLKDQGYNLGALGGQLFSLQTEKKKEDAFGIIQIFETHKELSTFLHDIPKDLFGELWQSPEIRQFLHQKGISQENVSGGRENNEKRFNWIVEQWKNGGSPNTEDIRFINSQLHTVGGLETKRSDFNDLINKSSSFYMNIPLLQSDRELTKLVIEKHKSEAVIKAIAGNLQNDREIISLIFQGPEDKKYLSCVNIVDKAAREFTKQRLQEIGIEDNSDYTFSIRNNENDIENIRQEITNEGMQYSEKVSGENYSISENENGTFQIRYNGENITCSFEEIQELNTEKEIQNFVNAFHAFRNAGLGDIWNKHRQKIFFGIGTSGKLNTKVSVSDGDYMNEKELKTVLRGIIYTSSPNISIPQETTIDGIIIKIRDINRNPQSQDTSKSNIGEAFRRKYISAEGDFNLSKFQQDLNGFE